MPHKPRRHTLRFLGSDIRRGIIRVSALCPLCRYRHKTHWTGHESRLNRQFGKRFGDDAYAFEELVAELGAAFVVGHVGFVDAMIEDHAAYVESWLKVLKNDKTAIFTASKQASLAYDFIIGKIEAQKNATL
jgi:antirestriction protein ArdC